MAAMPSRCSGLLVALLLVLITPAASSIPRSSSSSLDATAAADKIRRPPWNLSSQINKQGYLKQLFRRIPAAAVDDVGEYANDTNNYKDTSLLVPVVIRQVPGDGDCLFHAIAISLAFTENGHLMRLDTHDGLQELKAASRKLRRMAVECLVSSCSSKRQNNNSNNKSKRNSRRYKRLFIQGKDSMKTSQLLYTASSQYGITPEEYCELMMQDSYWGGGPEIVALCAVLRRPIHVYELVPLPIDRNGNISDEDENRHDKEDEKATTPLANKDRTNNKFCLRLLATFGSPKYDSNDALHILSADSRFPDIEEPHCALKEGNHFLAMFPVDRMRLCLRNYYANCLDNEGDGGRKEVSDRKQLVRGGDAGNIISTADNKMLVVEAESDEHLVGLPWLFHGEWYDDLPCDTQSPCQYEALVNDKKGWKCSTWFRLRRNNMHPKSKKKEHEGNQVTSKSPSNSMTRFVGYWINVFVKILAFCGDMA